MTLVAEIWITHPDLPLADSIASDLDVVVRLDYQTKAEPDDRIVFLHVSGEDRGAFGDALAADHTVSDARIVTMFPEQAIYRVEVSTDLEVVPRACTALGAEVREVRGSEGGWVVRLHLLTRDALEALREYCRDRDVTYRVRELANVDALPEVYSHGLTESQRVTLLLAYDAGYFEIPRSISQEELASELGISKSAVSQRLRRATAHLVEETLASGDR